jgi:hypothetical protein
VHLFVWWGRSVSPVCVGALLVGPCGYQFGL